MRRLAVAALALAIPGPDLVVAATFLVARPAEACCRRACCCPRPRRVPERPCHGGAPAPVSAAARCEMRCPHPEEVVSTPGTRPPALLPPVYEAGLGRVVVLLEGERPRPKPGFHPLLRRPPRPDLLPTAV